MNNLSENEKTSLEQYIQMTKSLKNTRRKNIDMNIHNGPYKLRINLTPNTIGNKDLFVELYLWESYNYATVISPKQIMNRQ